MDQMQLILWSQRMTSQAEQSRAAHAQHMRAEQVRQAQAAQPTIVSVLARAWTSLAGRTRTTGEPGALATQP